MYFNTLGQGFVFLQLLLIGFVSGLIVSIVRCIRTTTNNNWVVTLIVDLVSTLVIGLIYYFSVVALADGILHWYTLLGFGLGLLVWIKTIHKLVAKSCDIVYNLIRKWMKKFLSTKVGKILSK